MIDRSENTSSIQHITETISLILKVLLESLVIVGAIHIELIVRSLVFSQTLLIVLSALYATQILATIITYKAWKSVNRR